MSSLQNLPKLGLNPSLIVTPNKTRTVPHVTKTSTGLTLTLFSISVTYFGIIEFLVCCHGRPAPGRLHHVGKRKYCQVASMRDRKWDGCSLMATRPINSRSGISLLVSTSPQTRGIGGLLILRPRLKRQPTLRLDLRRKKRLFKTCVLRDDWGVLWIWSVLNMGLTWIRLRGPKAVASCARFVREQGAQPQTS